MRIAKPFGVRTITPKEIKRKYFLVFEGEKTEYQYFQGVNEYSSTLGIDKLIEIKPLMRSTGRESTSNPKQIIQQLIKHMSETIEGGISLESLIERVCDYLFYELELSENGIVSPKTIISELTALAKSTYSLLPENTVEDPKALLDAFTKHLKTGYNIENSAGLIVKYLESTEVVIESGFDTICIIVDRDKQSFKADQYDYVLEQCGKHGFNLHVSNPCFEFWLLLHYPNANELDKEALLNNVRITKRKRLTEILLREKLIGYKKNCLNFVSIMGGIDLAIQQEKLFCENIEELKTELGTNIGLLITSLREKKE